MALAVKKPVCQCTRHNTMYYSNKVGLVTGTPALINHDVLNIRDQSFASLPSLYVQHPATILGIK